jgi:hypothetical protein
VLEEKQLVVCNANADVIIYQSLEGGKVLQEKYRFQADFNHKDATIVHQPICRILFASHEMGRYSVLVETI